MNVPIVLMIDGDFASIVDVNTLAINISIYYLGRIVSILEAVVNECSDRVDD